MSVFVTLMLSVISSVSLILFNQHLSELCMGLNFQVVRHQKRKIVKALFIKVCKAKVLRHYKHIKVLYGWIDISLKSYFLNNRICTTRSLSVWTVTYIEKQQES